MIQSRLTTVSSTLPFPFKAPLAAAFLAATLVTRSALAQEPLALPPGMTPGQALQLLQQSPQLQSLVRQRVLTSGLTRMEIQQRLQAAGYPPNLLDAYLTGEATEAALVDVQMLEGISLLGVNAFRGIGSPEHDTAAQQLGDSVGAAQRVPGEGGLTLFGLDVFRQPSSQFQPLVAGPVDGSYPLGPGDLDEPSAK